MVDTWKDLQRGQHFSVMRSVWERGGGRKIKGEKSFCGIILKKKKKEKAVLGGCREDRRGGAFSGEEVFVWLFWGREDAARRGSERKSKGVAERARERERRRFSGGFLSFGGFRCKE